MTFSCDIIRLSPLSLEPSNSIDTGLKLVQCLRRGPSIRPISTVTALCSEGPMFRRPYVLKVLCSEGPLFRRSYVQKVLCLESMGYYLSVPFGHTTLNQRQ